MARMTGFEGVMVQFSWPSQGALAQYGADVTNMHWNERHFKTFLAMLAAQDWAKDIVLVSHSLGVRLLIPAIEYVDQYSTNADASNISNIILLSPDTDRQEFEKRIVDEVLTKSRVDKGRRVTIYLSAKDQALALSSTVHGYPRLGSTRCFDPFEAADLKKRGLPVRCYTAPLKYDIAPTQRGLIIIDTAAVSKGVSGHNDFRKSAAACIDFAAVVNGARHPSGRALTHLDHVFTLKPSPKGVKTDDIAACKISSPSLAEPN